MDEKNHEGLSSFNENNNFSREKILLLPFFVTIGNGSRDILLDLFNEFKPVAFGIIDETIESELNLNFSNYYLNIDENSNLDAEINTLKLMLNNGPIKFADKIDNSIKHLYYKFEKFASLEFSVLSYWAKNNLSWEIFNNVLSKIIRTQDNLKPQVLILFRENLKKEKFQLAPINMVA